MTKVKLSLSTLVFFTLLAISFLIKFNLLNEKNFLTHDESISVLSISATEGEYDTLTKPEINTLTAHEVKELTYSERITFSDVNTDMIQNDIHPPLYYYFKGKIRSVFNFSITNLIQFNFLFHLLSIALLFFISKSFLSRNWSFLVCILYIYSPAVFQNYFELRHYPMLEFFYLAHLLAFFKLKNNGEISLRSLFLVIVFCLSFIGASFTHFYAFIIPTALCGSLILNRGLKLLQLTIPIYLLSYGVVFIISPDYALPILEKLNASSSAESAQHMELAWAFIKSVFRFFTEKHVIVLLLIFLSIITAIIFRINLKRLVKSHPLPSSALCLVLLINGALYTLGISPKHALGYEYLNFLWPLLSVFMVLLLKTKRFILGLFCALMIASSLRSSYTVKRYINELPLELRVALKNTDAIKVSNFQRGFVPRIAEHLKPSCQITSMSKKTIKKFSVEISGFLGDEIEVDGVVFTHMK